MLLVLLLSGLGQAAATIAVAVSVPLLMDAAGTRNGAVLFAVLVALATIVGALRWIERVWSEHLGQDYAHEVRMGLLRHALTQFTTPSLGVTSARTTNDLSMIRNWISLGIAPLVVAGPLLAGALLALALLDPWLAAAAALPIGVLIAAVAVISPIARRRATRLRKARGRLAATVGDTVPAASAIRHDGGVDRELRRMHTLSRRVGRHAVSRAHTAGGLRGVAAGVATLTMIVVTATGAWLAIPATEIATALIVVGVMATPLSDLGRVAEYRQSFLAAETIIAPLLDDAARTEAREAAMERAATHLRRPDAGPIHPGVLHVADLTVTGSDERSRTVPELVALPGDRIVVDAGDPMLVEAALAVLTDPAIGASRAWVDLAGYRLLELPARARRSIVGSATEGVPLNRGTIARAVRYRVPGTSAPVDRELARVGLDGVVAALPDGERTELRSGGIPLSGSQRARLQVARALHGDPPLVVLDRIDADLGPAGCADVRQALADHPGIIVVVSEQPANLLDGWRTWDLSGLVDGEVDPDGRRSDRDDARRVDRARIAGAVPHRVPQQAVAAHARR